MLSRDCLCKSYISSVSLIRNKSQTGSKKWSTKLKFFSIPYLPVYNVHLCTMHTPILKPVFRKKKAFQHHSCRKIIFWKNSAEMSNLALPARKPVTGVDANHLMFCLFSDTSSFMMFSLFSAAVLLLHDRTRSVCLTPVTFL